MSFLKDASKLTSAEQHYQYVLGELLPNLVWIGQSPKLTGTLAEKWTGSGLQEA